MNLVIVIPAYDASRHIAGVLDRIAAVEELSLTRVVVVNDGSRDDTAQKVRQAG